MTEPNTQDRVNALAALAATFKRSTWSTAETEPIARALASARAFGVAEWLAKAELHEITDAACKRATGLGLEITIRVKERRAPKKKDQPDGK